VQESSDHAAAGEHDDVATRLASETVDDSAGVAASFVHPLLSSHSWDPAGPGGSYDQRMSNLATIQGIYGAFGKGGVPAILEVLDEHVEWEAWENNSAVNAGVPWMSARHGKQDVVHFFADLRTAPLFEEAF